MLAQIQTHHFPVTDMRRQDDHAFTFGQGGVQVLAPADPSHTLHHRRVAAAPHPAQFERHHAQVTQAVPGQLTALALRHLRVADAQILLGDAARVGLEQPGQIANARADKPCRTQWQQGQQPKQGNDAAVGDSMDKSRLSSGHGRVGKPLSVKRGR